MTCTYNRRLYKGNSYEIELPFSIETTLGDLTVTFYTDGEIKVIKDLSDITLSGDTMVMTLTEEDLEYLKDGVLYYTVEYDGDEYGEYTTNSPYVVVTPIDYSGTSLEVLLEEVYNSGYSEGWASGYISGYTVGQENCSGYTPSPDYYTNMPLTFEIISGGTIGWDNSETNVNIEYSVDAGLTWHNFTSLNVSTGDHIMFRGSGETGQMPVASPKGSRFTASTGAYFNAYGNLYSLLGSTGVTSLTAYGKATFFGLFSGNTGLISAGNLRMPATELQGSCYRDMFTLCINMTTAPELPAETLLATTCYMNMFYGSSKLNYVKCLAVNKQPADTSVWLWGVSETGIFVKHPDAVWASGGSYIPNGWTVIDAS